MTPYQTLTQPWRQAVAVWTVMAQAQTEFTLRMMGLTAPRLTARRPSPAPVAAPASAPEPVAAEPVAVPVVSVVVDAPVVAEAAAAPEPAPSAEVVPLRLVTEAIAAATAPEVEMLPEAEPEASPFVAEEPASDEPLAILAEPAQEEHEEFVQAAVQSLVAEDEAPAALTDLLPKEAAPSTPRPARRAPTGSRRAPKAKRNS